VEGPGLVRRRLDWHRVRLVRIGGHWLAAIHNPAKPGYVSLRATAAHSAHNTVTQTIIGADTIVRALARQIRTSQDDDKSQS